MPKSILKKPSTPTSALPVHSSPQQDRNLEKALHHARLIQERKDAESLILQITETILDFPSSDTSDPAKPSPFDAYRATNLLQSFQPSDYDALIEERNIENRCGYVLCPRSNHRQERCGKYKIIQDPSAGRDGFNIVDKKDLERWCSEACRKRALYVRTQLNEEPAWARVRDVADILLLDESMCDSGNERLEQELATGIRRMDITSGEKRMVDDLENLALERGDQSSGNRVSPFVASDIKEIANSPTTAILPNGAIDSSRAIEGYVPKEIYQRRPRINGNGNMPLDEDNDLDDIIPTI
ncbi:MAG: hypothetical protein Q9190_001474 [Brigantiaea leucoxantha]